MNLSAILAELADTFATVPNVRVFDYPPDSLPVGQGDVVYLELDEIDYQRAFAKGMAMVDVVATVVVQMTDPRAARVRMRELLSSGTGVAGTRSLIDAVEDARTLGGLTGGMVLYRAAPPKVEMDGEARRLTVEMTMGIPVGRT